MDSVKKRKRDNFFGALNYKGRRSGYVTYNPIISSTSILLMSDNVVDIHNYEKYEVTRYLALSKTKALPLLDSSKYKRVKYINEEGKTRVSYLIRLNRADFMDVLDIQNEEFKNAVNIKYEDTYESLFEQAKIQSNKKYKVYFT